MLEIKSLNTQDSNFATELQNIYSQQLVKNANISDTVEKIISNIQQYKDAALVDYTARFDNLVKDSASELEINLKDAQKSFDNLSPEDKKSLRHAHQRIEEYHLLQKQNSWEYTDSTNNILGQKITAITKVGMYVPGGQASYPSTVLMNAIPAKIAGVQEIIMVFPTPYGKINNMVLAAAYLSGVTKIYTIGGAQAIAALAYGTQTIPAVNKIVGPGNAYVAEAKRRVFGKVGIDMIAGPSDILIISDGSIQPDWLASDLMAQAEHDPNARAVFISNSAQDIQAVQQQIDALLPSLDRKDIIAQSLANNGLFIKTSSIQESCKLSNTIAPEHLELAVENAKEYVNHIHNAGAIFVGGYSCESLGDYCAGPNHTLPTYGTAKFTSPLGVYDFQKRSSIINIQPSQSRSLYKTAAHIADREGLSAHALAARLRINA
jgi:histidinol dehydrogenase